MLCLANFLEVPVNRLSSEGPGDKQVRFEDKVYWIMTGGEAYDEFYKYVDANLWTLDKEMLGKYLTVSPEVDKEEFKEVLDAAIRELEQRADVLIRAHIPHFKDFVDALATYEFEDNFSLVFSMDGKEHYSKEFHYYIYRTV